MDQRGGGCCIARYAHDMSKVDRIMRRFRPIAPKPTTSSTNGGDGGSLSGGGSSGSSSSTVEDISGGMSAKSGGRCKRRLSTTKDSGSSPSNKKRRRCATSRRKKPSPVKTTDSKGLKTTQLLPEASEGRCGRVVSSSRPSTYPLWLSFENGGSVVGLDAAMGLRRVVVGSWVRVERVMDAWGVHDGRTDEERVAGLERDACPGFVTDGLSRVKWVNEAYKRMATGGGGRGGEVVAWVVMEDGVVAPPPVGCAGFTCRVRVVTCGENTEEGTTSKVGGLCGGKTVACDVWRMGCGGFAWRLDTCTALTLGLGL